MRDLCHPVEPQSKAGSVNVVPADFDIDRPVELDPRHFRSSEQPPHVDVVDSVSGDYAERGAQTADDAGLFAVRDSVAAD